MGVTDAARPHALRRNRRPLFVRDGVVGAGGGASSAGLLPQRGCNRELCPTGLSVCVRRGAPAVEPQFGLPAKTRTLGSRGAKPELKARAQASGADSREEVDGSGAMPVPPAGDGLPASASSQTSAALAPIPTRPTRKLPEPEACPSRSSCAVPCPPTMHVSKAVVSRHFM